MIITKIATDILSTHADRIARVISHGPPEPGGAGSRKGYKQGMSNVVKKQRRTREQNLPVQVRQSPTSDR